MITSAILSTEETSLPKVNELTQKCRKEADKYGRLLDEYRMEIAEKSEHHAQQLEMKKADCKSNLFSFRRSNKLKWLTGSFADTKTAAADPLRASNAYKEIADALRNASKAVKGAKQTAEYAYLDADPKSETSMWLKQPKIKVLQLSNKPTS
ncbi:unnamed protein product [Gongylonema pulchrum]|uniref:Variant surface glycoprotein n=1 Tax=Gongylonema pulchrum TaxID=637853 RepID=A0A183DX82_9BILA|nr:unnamed protein product [Gongylonema pulchrum]